jgi:hypothetical protein
MRKRKKPGAPKEVHYELIPRVSDVGEPMYALLDRILTTHHGDRDLGEVRIALAWCTSWKPDVDGRITLGKCKKATDLDRELAPWDFVILLQQEFWQNLRVTDHQRAALLDHELMHAAVKYDPETGEPVIDARGRIVYRLRKHDIEEFADIVTRYGCYKHDLEQFAAALGRAQETARATWIGATALQADLRRAGVEVPVDVLAGWSEDERREARTWALVKTEPMGALLETMPACLAAATSTGAPPSSTVS